MQEHQGHSGNVVLPAEPHRWQRVDMLRGVAVLLVLCHHHPAIPFLQGIGWIGVDLFFVLSGFLVSGLVFDEYRRSATFHPVRFLVRRGFKIYPSFYFLIMVSSILMWGTGRQDPLMNYIAEVFFFQNYHEGLWGHTWTLAVEEHFYLLLVIAAAALIRFRVELRWRGFVASCIAVFLIVPILRWNDLLALEPGELPRIFPTHLRIDSLLGGVLLAGWHRFRPVSFHAVFSGRMIFLLLALSGLLYFVKWSQSAAISLTYHLTYIFGLSAAYVAAMVAVGLAVGQGRAGEVRKPWVYFTRPLVWVGRISYNTYLLHLLVLVAVELVSVRIGIQGSLLEFFVFVCASCIAGYAATQMIEVPFLRLREQYFPKTRSIKIGNH